MNCDTLDETQWLLYKGFQSHHCSLLPHRKLERDEQIEIKAQLITLLDKMKNLFII